MRTARLLLLAWLALTCAVFTRAAAQTPEPSGKDVTFSHLKDGGNKAYERRLSNGEKFNVVITDTCPDVFAYEVHGVMREEQPPRASVKGGNPLRSKSLPVVHDASYGGYIVSITRTGTAAACVDSEKLEPSTLIISTPVVDWDLSFSGGFTISSLTSPQYSLQPHPSDAAKQQINEDPDKEDAAALGIAAFVHLYHHKLPWLAGMFGLGIREGNNTEYFLGGGVRFSDKATVNAGVVFGPVARLPNGVNTTDPVSDSNVLTDLPTQMQRGFFVGISYSFINVRDKLQQPFAGSAGTPGGTPGATAARTAGAARPPAAVVCKVKLEPAELALPATVDAKATVTVTPDDADCEWKVLGVPAWAAFSAEAAKGKQTLTITVTEENDTRQDRPVAVVDIADQKLKLVQRKK